jgi:hypothetical protein
MGRYASDNGGGSFTPAPLGTHVARCFRIVDLGTQHGEYKGQPTRRSQILVSWELPDELIEIEGEQRPITTSRFYTNSLGEKANLRKDLESWRGRSFTDDELQKFDLESILGKPCLLTIVGGENGKTKVATVSGLPRGTTCPDQINDIFSLWLDEWDEDKFESLSDGVKGIIKKSEEYVESNGDPGHYAPPTRMAAPDDDDIPF